MDGLAIYRVRHLFARESVFKADRYVCPGEYFARVRAEAEAAGYDRCVVKMPWFGLWEPDQLLGCDLVVLVARDWRENGASIARRWRVGRDRADRLAFEGQARILELGELYGWPVWEFGVEGCHDALEGIVGHDLPAQVYDGGRVRERTGDAGERSDD
jgi:hypothetical protein